MTNAFFFSPGTAECRFWTNVVFLDEALVDFRTRLCILFIAVCALHDHGPMSDSVTVRIIHIKNQIVLCFIACFVYLCDSSIFVARILTRVRLIDSESEKRMEYVFYIAEFLGPISLDCTQNI